MKRPALKRYAWRLLFLAAVLGTAAPSAASADVCDDEGQAAECDVSLRADAVSGDSGASGDGGSGGGGGDSGEVKGANGFGGPGGSGGPAGYGGGNGGDGAGGGPAGGSGSFSGATTDEDPPGSAAGSGLSSGVSTWGRSTGFSGGAAGGGAVGGTQPPGSDQAAQTILLVGDSSFEMSMVAEDHAKPPQAAAQRSAHGSREAGSSAATTEKTLSLTATLLVAGLVIFAVARRPLAAIVRLGRGSHSAA